MLIALQQQARTARGHRRATRWVCVALKADQTARSARAFPNAWATVCLVNISRQLTDNGTELTDQMFGSRARQPSGQHEFHWRYQALGIAHRPILPRHPQTNDMGEVFERERSSLKERFNGTLADPGSLPGQAVPRTHPLRSSQNLKQTLHRYVTFYNRPLPQSALNAQTPDQAIQDWHTSHPELLHRRRNNRPELDRAPYLTCTTIKNS